ncbi:protein prenylyltransferase [Anaeromyces robustus]|uniref:Protein prenylyltransferase n=1 Tax=Anaeromyces robustus TaxID=1754192 RepID=A0A1Y1XRD8_9FUNG|nr:protein prenylyltransferase [Anaeromyces robustus]|eukprot:ORX88297.1 protein prenylyltransferase [Anaeromyces robustus]
MDAESLYNTLKNIIINKTLIEVSFVPTQGDGEYQPFILMENCLGIPFPIVPKSLEYLKKKFVELRKDKSLNYKEIDYCTKCILLFNGEYITAWNERKNLIQLGYIKPEFDLQFTKLCLTKHPKSSNLWYHRQWILKRYEELINFDKEFEIIEKSINRYATNYFAWNHRIWLLNYMTIQKLIDEFKSTQSSMYKHVSDHAGWNYLLTIFKRIVSIYKEDINNKNKLNELKILWNEHIEFVKKSLKEFPGHETIWYYLRILAGFVYQNKDIIYKNEKEDIISFFEKEITFINNEYLNENNVNILLVEEKFALQYKAWLYSLFENNITKEDYNKLLTEIENYQCMSDDQSLYYLIDIIHRIQVKV